MDVEIIVRHLAGSSLAGQEQRFKKARLTIGRGPTNDIAFDLLVDKVVSRSHAEIFAEGGRLFIRDRGHHNGTLVDGVRIEGPFEIRSENVVTLGFEGPELSARLAGPGALVGAQDPNRTVGESTFAMAVEVLHLANAQRGMKPPKRFVSETMVERKVTEAISLERSRSHRLAYAVGGVCLLTLAMAATTFWYTRRTRSDLRSELNTRTAEISSNADRLGDRFDAVFDVLGRLKDRQQMTEQQQREFDAQVRRVMSGLESEQQRLREANASDSIWKELVSRYELSIFMVFGIEKGKGDADDQQMIGTAFAVTPDGWLATNAHVVEEMRKIAKTKNAIQSVFQNKTGIAHRVLEMKTHPGFNGERSPDVALIKIETTERLRPMELASETELRELSAGTHIGTLGFPGELQEQYLAHSDKENNRLRGVVATFKDGWIGRITGYTGENTEFERAKRIQHSASLTGGTSGSPMFLSDGKVIAINNAGLDYHNRPEDSSSRPVIPALIGYAVRIDELFPLLPK